MLLEKTWIVSLLDTDVDWCIERFLVQKLPKERLLDRRIC